MEKERKGRKKFRQRGQRLFGSFSDLTGQCQRSKAGTVPANAMVRAVDEHRESMRLVVHLCAKLLSSNLFKKKPKRQTQNDTSNNKTLVNK